MKIFISQILTLKPGYYWLNVPDIHEHGPEIVGIWPRGIVSKKWQGKPHELLVCPAVVDSSPTTLDWYQSRFPDATLDEVIHGK